MRMIEIAAGQQRDDCVALLCAEVFGSAAGLTPLVRFAAITSELLPNHAARMVALAVDGALKSVALLVLEEQGRAAELTLLATPKTLRGQGYATALVERITASTALRVSVTEPTLEAFFSSAGFSRWLDAPAGENARVGLNAQHPAQRVEELDEVIAVDDARIVRTFKHDPATFERFKQQFVDGLARAERYFSVVH
ncbi:hypothetical protein R84981_000319 [Carnimonas sp. R-84981]